MYICRKKLKSWFTESVVCSSLFAALSFTHKSAKTHQTAETDNLMCAQQLLTTKEQLSYITLPPLIFQGFLENECVFKCRALACHRARLSCDVWAWKREKVQPESSRAEKYRLLQGFLLIWARMEEINGEMSSAVAARERGWAWKALKLRKFW